MLKWNRIQIGITLYRGVLEGLDGKIKKGVRVRLTDPYGIRTHSEHAMKRRREGKKYRITLSES